MALDGKLLAQARKELERTRQRNEKTREARINTIYARLPEVAEIDRTLRGQMHALAKLTLAKPATLEADLARIEAENLTLQEKRRALLKQAGYPPDYTDEIFTCPDCRDTGYVDGNLCHCLKRLYNAQVTQQLSGLLRGNERFAGFDLGFYPDLPDENGNNPRECMAIIRDFCQNYAQHFDGAAPSLVFSGGPGLGKTFLSACIARTVSDGGWSVAYDSAATALGAFERTRFAREEADRLSAERTVAQYLSCDLMILDDLGTEMRTQPIMSALYTLINQREQAGKPTIISTNLTDQELERQYTPQVVSRLLGSYHWLHFLGNDIRRMGK